MIVTVIGTGMAGFVGTVLAMSHLHNKIIMCEREFFQNFLGVAHGS